MTVRFVFKPSEMGEDNWEKFVRFHPDGNIFQTPYMYHVVEKTLDYKPQVIGMIDERGEILGVLLSIVQVFAKGLLEGIASRSVLSGGPLVRENDRELLNEILVKYEERIGKQVVYTEIRNFTDTGEYKAVFEGVGYEYEEHLNILVDLTKSEEELWKELHPMRRRNIKSAYKEKVYFEEVRDSEALRETYKILSEVYKIAQLPLPHESLFESAIYESRDHAGMRIFAARYEEQIIGAIYVLCYKGMLYEWYVGSYRKYLGKNPNILPWEVFKWGKSHGYKVFDFGGAGKPGEDYGVREYKKKFGGTVVNYGRFKKIHQPLKYKAAKLGFKLWQKMRHVLSYS